jgi:6,7-dimethyl-8-ribityllumazine synthase
MGKSKNLSAGLNRAKPSAKGMRIAVVVSKWNEEITDALYQGAVSTLKDCGCAAKDIVRVEVPGSYELPTAAALLCNKKTVDAVICLGCVIQGETRHFEFICQAVANGLVNVSLKYKKPVIFGVLTTNDFRQAKERSGGKHGNKGVEAALTGIQMTALMRQEK